ncbi:DNA-binding transcriptional regulator, LysR family [Chromobacterium violaceum]|uniref:Probable transcriptional regulator n=1 Tax=Chromobacterium violaceum (strain ATCC 12472 / DSM 30191 / JCM 1249 / CCUG 213 / NBRC 12614 / NCIMB 9131 / NCTC 9757 / MK) TaxID=243365 RepID=Q7NUJ1_CHRVO|nr:LysR family transcriptional regulator [Chromobacterium violaceum]AAQ60376.1 probable transcriptional regulator [Chromobacterium violaceum ATCC 12472]KMN51667.1 LysR family transcriptional regulator [Chromobacterium violaceum]KMN84658.1 LysR family transcriptional regulator [Chromobacterium violaceum]KMN88615.1 LysR family transcriptional regulator [Chromobacterium violaceum]KMO05910.1 LysR family transcriptional regulator [Chromobacterium violaceum]
MDRVQAMRVFVAVVDCGGFTRAAQQLQLPRATVSSAVQQLEAQLGARLLHRTTRRVQLTLDGGTFYERCQQLLADFDELESLFSQQGASPRGKLRIDVPGPIGRQVLAPALPEFFRLYPGIELELGVTDRPVDLIQEGVDCVIRVGALAESRLVARRIGMLPQGNYASPDYLAAFGAPASPDALAGHRAVNYASPSTGKVFAWEYLQDGERRELALQSLVSVNQVESYIACALAGLGMIQLPRYDAEPHVAAGALVEVLADWPPPAMPVSVLYPHRRHLSRRVQVFVEWAGALLRERLRLGA